MPHPICCRNIGGVDYLSSKIGKATATILNFCVSHGSAARFLRNGEKYYAYLFCNLYPTMKKSRSVND